MATLILSRVWINRLDTGEAVNAQSWDRTQDYDMDGDVGTYAGGRQRSISVEGERGSFGCTLRRVSLATILTLREWKGLPVQVRDHRGQLWVGVYLRVVPIEQSDPAWYDAALTVRTVDAPEGV
ncbi:hypothetical protein [Micromonospora sp. 4G55]|uniref:hypothetical protein n=1 Tax=Micromonospora sp. 4G55 TaxID=2806102 RepID=UPI001A4A54F4|nr:hypothetical protein [Micromonospora sp. 4G55]MBM0257046.1 hypothetical protein [Micromonospora sp. 4G55]